VAHFKLSPLEKLTYVYKTYAALSESAGVRRVDGAPVSANAPFLVLQPHDFPVELVELSADPALLALGNLSGALAYAAPGGAAVTTPFALTSAALRTSVALPRDGASPAITVDAQPVTGAGATLRLGPLPASGQHFTLASFAEYGLHKIAIACAFPAGAPGPFAIDVLADGQADAPANVTTLYLTRGQPTADWSYVAASPFRAGYRWRAHAGGAWSPSLAPGAPLQVSAPPAGAARPAVWELRGVHLYAQPGDPPGRVRYVPGAPTPQLDDQGRPTLMLIDTGKSGILSLGARLELTEAQRADLEVDLLEKLTAVDRIDFQPAPFTVGAVTLSLGDGAGRYQPLDAGTSLGAPPYNATFSVKLDVDQCARVTAALGGAPRSLKIDYTLALAPDAAATFDGAPATLTRTTDVAGWFSAGSGAAHIQKLGA
jgi:hypothetical protein